MRLLITLLAIQMPFAANAITLPPVPTEPVYFEPPVVEPDA